MAAAAAANREAKKEERLERRGISSSRDYYNRDQANHPNTGDHQRRGSIAERNNKQERDERASAMSWESMASRDYLRQVFILFQFARMRRVVVKIIIIEKKKCLNNLAGCGGVQGFGESPTIGNGAPRESRRLASSPRCLRICRGGLSESERKRRKRLSERKQIRSWSLGVPAELQASTGSAARQKESKLFFRDMKIFRPIFSIDWSDVFSVQQN